VKVTTLCFLVDGSRVLLALKKRGFGVGRWNGVGGKVEQGESIEDAVVREAVEEIGVTLKIEDLTKVAVHRFAFENCSDMEQECHVFLARQWEGQPKETEEMAPQWFDVSALPFDSMWPEDRYWLPPTFNGKRTKGDFLFSRDTK